MTWAVTLGVSFYLILYLFSLKGGFEVMGVHDEAVSRMVKDVFLWDVILYHGKLAAAHAFLGALNGVWNLLCWMRVTKNKKARVLLVIFGTAFVHFLIWCGSSIRYPQVHPNFFLKDLLCSHLSPFFFTLTFFVVISIQGAIIFYPFVRRNIKLPIGILGGIACLLIAYRLLDLNTPPSPKKTNLLLILVDSLRPDHIHSLGYERDTTPTIDSLIEKGVVFTNCYTPIARTFPSVLSILTSTYPHTHGIRHMFPSKAARENMRLHTLPQALKDAGFHTCVIADYAGDIFKSHNLGFEVVDAPRFDFKTLIKEYLLKQQSHLIPYICNPVGRTIFPELREFMKLSDPKVVGSKARRYLRATKPPFFLTLFFSTPHFPFASPHPYYKFFADPHYDGPFKYEKPILSGLRQGAKGDEDKRQVRALYDGAIRAVDDEIHKVLETLRDRDLEHNTIIVIMSDHGVSLYESGVGMSQGEHLRGPWTLAITFVLYHPKENFKTQKVDSFVSSLDVMPTLLDLLEIEKPDTLEGKSLIAFLSGSEDEDREVFAETGIWFYPIDTKFFERERIPYPDITKLGEIDLKHGCDIVIKEKYEDILNIARHRMVIYDGWKLIYMPTINGVKYELYNIKHDPYNEHNLIDQEKEVAHELKQRLFRWLKRDTRYKIKEGFLVPL